MLMIILIGGLLIVIAGAAGNAPSREAQRHALTRAANHRDEALALLRTYARGASGARTRT